MYEFTLEPLLMQRKFIEESLQKELALIQDQYNVRINALEELAASKAKYDRKLRRTGEKGAPISELKFFVEYFKRLSIETYEARQALEKIQANLDAKRSEVVEAMKGRKILENLKEKGLQAYRDSLRKKEMKAADETAINLFNRNVKSLPGKPSR